MRSITQTFFAVLMCFTIAGCYHARIETGLTPSAQVIDIPFALGWVYGLVPPETVKTSSECTNGVAIVETEHSFVNSLVGAITFGLLTPMHIKVTCATGGGMGMNEEGHSEIKLSADASSEEVINAFSKAADEAVEEGKEIYVRFE